MAVQQRCDNWKDPACPHGATSGWADERHLVPLVNDGVRFTLCVECYMARLDIPAHLASKVSELVHDSPEPWVTHLSMPDPPGSTRIEVIREKLASMRSVSLPPSRWQ